MFVTVNRPAARPDPVQVPLRWFPRALVGLRHGDDDLAACVPVLHAAQALSRVG